MALKTHNNKGFTLLELLMVILVIGILVSFAIPEYQSLAEKAYMTEALIAIKAIRKYDEYFVLENGRRIGIVHEGSYQAIDDMFTALNLTRFKDTSAPGYTKNKWQYFYNTSHLTTGADTYVLYAFRPNIPLLDGNIICSVYFYRDFKNGKIVEGLCYKRWGGTWPDDWVWIEGSKSDVI